VTLASHGQAGRLGGVRDEALVVVVGRRLPVAGTVARSRTGGRRGGHTWALAGNCW
jgi:hypothetical protein